MTLVITSFNRFDLLRRTIDSFNRVNTYPVSEVIIIDDSGNKEMHRKIKQQYSNYHLILNDKLIRFINPIYIELVSAP